MTTRNPASSLMFAICYFQEKQMPSLHIEHLKGFITEVVDDEGFSSQRRISPKSW